MDFTVSIVLSPFIKQILVAEDEASLYNSSLSQEFCMEDFDANTCFSDVPEGDRALWYGKLELLYALGEISTRFRQHLIRLVHTNNSPFPEPDWLSLRIRFDATKAFIWHISIEITENMLEDDCGLGFFQDRERLEIDDTIAKEALKKLGEKERISFADAIVGEWRLIETQNVELDRLFDEVHDALIHCRVRNEF